MAPQYMALSLFLLPSRAPDPSTAGKIRRDGKFRKQQLYNIPNANHLGTIYASIK